MMAFEQNFIVSIIHNDKPLREFNEEGRRTCRIPFNSEYKIRLKNNRNSRAWAVIEIDGMTVFPVSTKLLLKPYDNFDIERFVVDMIEGNHFKFVQASGSNGVQDPTSKENGLIRVTFWPEKVYSLPAPTRSRASGQQVNCSRKSPLRGMNVNCDDGDWVTMNCDRGATVPDDLTVNEVKERALNLDDKGATVEGSKSTQAFASTNAHFEVEHPVTIDIWMKGLLPLIESLHDQVLVHIEFPCWIQMNGVKRDLLDWSISKEAALFKCQDLEIKTTNYKLV